MTRFRRKNLTHRLLAVRRSGLGELEEGRYSKTSRPHAHCKIACWLHSRIPHPFMRQLMRVLKEQESATLAKLMGKAGMPVISGEEISAHGIRPKVKPL